MIDPVWEEIHSKRQWLLPPNEQLVTWLCAKYGKIEYDQRKKIKILDIGCGQGSSTLFIAPQGFHVVAIDGSKSALAKLSSNLSVYGIKDVDLVCCDMAKIPYEDGYFDAVVDVASVCMSDDCQGIFDEVARVLKPSGRLFSTMPATDTVRGPWTGYGPVTFFDPPDSR